MYRVREEGERGRPISTLDAGRPREAGGGRPRPRLDVSTIGVGDVVGWMLRSAWLIAVLAVLGAAAGFLAYGLVPPRYTAYADLLIEPDNLKVANNDLFAQRSQSDAQLLDVESRMRVITSGNVLQRVAAQLKLADDPDFGRPRTPLAKLMARLSPQPAAGDRRLAVVQALSQRVKATRQERSYVVTIAAWGETPEQAVAISAAVVTAFEAELNESEGKEAARITAGLRERLGALKDEAARADAQVESFRAAHGLQKIANGQLLSAQSLDGLNAKIADLRVQAAQANSRFNDARAAMRSGTDSDALKSPVMTQLQIERASLQRRLASLEGTYGASYPALVQARDERRSAERAIATERKRLLEDARTEVQRSKSVLDDLTRSVAALKKTVSDDDRQQIALRELERTAATRTSTYQSALTRLGEVAERGRLDAVDVRAITEPTLPVRPSFPPSRSMLAAGGGAAGLLLGITLAAALGLRRMTGTVAAPVPARPAGLRSL